VEDFPAHLLEDLDFRWVDEVGEVFAAALRQTRRR
jgi:hypothetical protein